MLPMILCGELDTDSTDFKRLSYNNFQIYEKKSLNLCGFIVISIFAHQFNIYVNNASVVELVDTLDLGSSAARCESSSLSARTLQNILDNISRMFFYFGEREVYVTYSEVSLSTRINKYESSPKTSVFPIVPRVYDYTSCFF